VRLRIKLRSSTFPTSVCDPKHTQSTPKERQSTHQPSKKYAVMNADQLLLSLKSWPEENLEETSVSSLINRIQAQRGHFRDVNESLLEEEIAAGKDEPQDDELHGDPENKANGGTADKTAGDQESATELRNAKVKMAALVGYVRA
jgi:hypothetical protein